MTTSSAAVSRRAFLSAVGTGLLAAAVFVHDPAAALADPRAEQFVASIGDAVLAAARAGSESQFRAVMRRSADIPTIANYSLGRYRSRLPANQRQEYYRLFEGYIANVFLANANKISGSKLNITGSQSRSDSVIVTSQVEFSDGRPAMPVLWRLVKSGGGYKIFDVNVQGVWLAGLTQQSFVSVISQNNGDMTSLINFLKK
ncbi:MlaC/ttg2D family ABC transporter substrate-binding protein [Rhodoligotrophos defluvii]|uniref:MlaC/ttg2D family ABC transporter substrate-binding protein n=1 Tax=Rhodoligotrophos defluvii TaxID=2561934 RepID=UPI001484E321|nr:ABC transporter substrate-binding protein [Rhodoligotrophos defluvii]